jgi:hypothetical protein
MGFHGLLVALLGSAVAVTGISGTTAVLQSCSTEPNCSGCHILLISGPCDDQDADRLWALTPPAEAALHRQLSSHGAELRIGWRVERTAPPPSAHGGPLCDGAVAVRLAGASRTQLLDVLDVSPLALVWGAAMLLLHFC